ncbi:hypothetical protein BGZ90_012381 [Linnemannia elongata]|nr:hypothetical protein BGZ90_012381 [Linnemannia elongata]
MSAYPQQQQQQQRPYYAGPGQGQPGQPGQQGPPGQGQFAQAPNGFPQQQQQKGPPSPYVNARPGPPMPGQPGVRLNNMSPGGPRPPMQPARIRFDQFRVKCVTKPERANTIQSMDTLRSINAPPLTFVLTVLLSFYST